MLASKYCSVVLAALVFLWCESVLCRVHSPQALQVLQVLHKQTGGGGDKRLPYRLPYRLPPAVPRIASYCQGCALRRTEMEAMLTEAEITDLRIQHVKSQILNKLRLIRPPQVSRDVSGLPKPLRRGTALLPASASPGREEDADDVDDFYGKTNQVVVFLQERTSASRRDEQQPAGSTSFSLTLPPSLEADDVTAAQLWLFKGANDTLVSFPTYHVLEEDNILTPHREGDMPEAIAIAVQKTSGKEGWFKVDLTWSVKEWLEKHRFSPNITVTCPDCIAAVGRQGSRQPFFVINTTSANRKSRSKRHVNCSPSMAECCREKLFISFRDIGWDDWIIQPAGYDAYYCRGSCTTAAALTLSGSHYHTVIRKFLRETKVDRSLELVPCCTATRLTSLQLLYIDSNHTITQKTLPNMVVASCGCM